MGVNLVPRIPLNSINIETLELTKENNEHDFEDHCLSSEGHYRILTFDFVCHNIGDKDFVAGSPKTRPDIFIQPKAHPHWHLKGFNKYQLISVSSGKVVRSLKQSFCINDMVPLSFPESEHKKLRGKFVNCEHDYDVQGISAGWADVYSSSTPCQYIILRDPERKINVPNGEFILKVETNAIQDEGPFKGRRMFEAEDSYDDNVLRIRLRIRGEKVDVVPPSLLYFLKSSF